ncbi:hypothetical protein L3X38_003068 [Prunus dulcis]|uniref:Uncharacterized protein n=1 Tax=Prunus dulcis TaxID=3755 RepID=A0AAD4X084_PRUDU|nr:hypothetical protein L3X38_003068 [Prunus dulcis]
MSANSGCSCLRACPGLWSPPTARVAEVRWNVEMELGPPPSLAKTINMATIRGKKQIFKQRKRNRKGEDKSQVVGHSSGLEIGRIKKDGNLGDGNSHRRVRVSSVVGLYDYVYTLYLAKHS